MRNGAFRQTIEKNGRPEVVSRTRGLFTAPDSPYQTSVSNAKEDTK